MTQKDEEQIRILAVFHYVLGGMAALFALLPVIHFVMGLFFILAPDKVQGDVPPTLIGWFFVIFSGIFILTGWIFAGFVIAAGRSLARRRRYLFCLVMAGVACLFVPFGTVLGVFTILVLSRASVKEGFQPPAA